MEFSEIQDKISKGIRKRLEKKQIKPSIDLTMTHLIEEIGEVAQQINNEKLKRKPFDLKNIAEEISDSIMLLIFLAEQYNINIEKEIIDKIEKIKQRDKL